MHTSFDVVEATIADIHRALRAGTLTATRLVELYLARIKAFNGTAVDEPDGILGPITANPARGQINALITLNLRPGARRAWGFDDRKARTLTNSRDDAPDQPDALETAAALDRHLAATGELKGPLHGIVFAIKDMLDTRDMRTTSGADADYADDRPPADATIVARLREAGAIILAKANMGEYASGSRSAFGGTMVNPYDLARDAGGSSGGSASAVAASLVTCAISEEGGPSIRMPSRVNCGVGLSPSQWLVSRAAMIGGGGLNDRVGPACRTVADAACVLDAIAGWDARDDLTASAVGRTPASGYVAFTRRKDLAGLRIGVVREYMDRSLFTAADHESIAIAERAVDDLRALGATIVDPGDGGALFKDAIDRHVAANLNAALVAHFPQAFTDGDSNTALARMALDPGRVPAAISLRDFGVRTTAAGEARFHFNSYLARRGDARITSLADLIRHSRFYRDEWGRDTRFRDVRAVLEEMDAATTFDSRERDANRIAIQQIVMHAMTLLGLDAVTYPTGNIPPALIKAPVEPDVAGRSHQAWTLLGTMGFPAITVPAGFTTHVYDRVRDPAAPGGTRLIGPVPATLPVGIDFLARPFDEATLFTIAAAYEARTRHRRPPPGFGPHA